MTSHLPVNPELKEFAFTRLRAGFPQHKLHGVTLLLLVSVIWGFSFGMFKGSLAQLDPNLTAFLRMALALPVFLPFLRRDAASSRVFFLVGLLGAVQYGVMYSALNFSYRFLSGWEVALMTIFTPIYVLLIESAWQRRVDIVYFSMGLLAVLGAGVIQYQKQNLQIALSGFLLVQVSNVVFAFGQCAFRRLCPMIKGKPVHVYAVAYAGALVVTGLATLVSDGWRELPQITLRQWGVLAYMGMLASGLSFFWWNLGATRVNAGTLAVFNNLKIPLAILVALTIFNETADMKRLAVGGGIMLLAGALTEWRGRRVSYQE